MSERLDTQPVPDKELAAVIPISRESILSERDEVINFAEYSVHETTDYLMHRFCHPSNKTKKGITLAESLDKLLATQKSIDSSTLAGRLTELQVQAENLYYDDEVYDRKAEKDEVFKSLVNALKSTNGAKGVELQRKVGLRLLTIRSSMADATDHDELWQDVTSRLLVSRPE